MPVMQLMGGLGNQMFQYAAAKSLSLKRGFEVKFDFDDPYPYVKRKFTLDCFNTHVNFASFLDLWNCKPKTKVIKRLFKYCGLNYKGNVFKEKQDYKYDKAFFDCPDNAYLQGFWQNENYFKDIAEYIRQDFSLSKPLSKNAQIIYTKIKSQNSVSLHIRRGDYATVKQTNSLHGLVPLEYYYNSLKYILEQTEKINLFVFSDDLPWAKNNLIFNNKGTTIIYVEDTTDVEDMYLMSSCEHNIIANSSFSWWAAWLNSNSNKIVTAPKQWIKQEIDSSDLIPSSWKRF